MLTPPDTTAPASGGSSHLTRLLLNISSTKTPTETDLGSDPVSDPVTIGSESDLRSDTNTASFPHTDSELSGDVESVK